MLVLTILYRLYPGADGSASAVNPATLSFGIQFLNTTSAVQTVTVSNSNLQLPQIGQTCDISNNKGN